MRSLTRATASSKWPGWRCPRDLFGRILEMIGSFEQGRSCDVDGYAMDQQGPTRQAKCVIVSPIGHPRTRCGASRDLWAELSCLGPWVHLDPILGVISCVLP